MYIVADPQSTYKIVCHFFSVITHNEVISSQEERNSSRTIELNSSLVNGSLNLATTFVDKRIIVDDFKSEFSTEDTIDGKSSPKIPFEDVVNSINRAKRDASNIEQATKKTLRDNDVDCSLYLSQFSSNYLKNDLDVSDNELNKMYDYCQNKIQNGEEVAAFLETEPRTINIYQNTYDVTSAPEMKQISAPSLAQNNFEMTDFPDISEAEKEKYLNKRNPSFDSIPIKEYLVEKSGGSKPYTHNNVDNVLPEKSWFVNHENQHFKKRTWPYPPTGPDGSNFAESVKTSQQLTVGNNQLYKPVCFRAPNTDSFNPTSYVCIPITPHQFEPYPGSFISPEVFNKICPDGNCDSKGNAIDPTLPTLVSPSGINTDSSPNGNQQSILMPPSYSPNIQVPTAIASPNPYYFPTFNGAPIMSQFPYDFRQPQPMSPQFNSMWPSRGGMPGFQNPPPFNMYNPQLYGHSFHGPPGMRWTNSFPRQYQQPYVQSVPSHSQTDQQNPAFCMYVPVQSHQFPVVNGVANTKNTRVVDDPEMFTPSFRYDNHSLQESHKSGNYFKK